MDPGRNGWDGMGWDGNGQRLIVYGSTIGQGLIGVNGPWVCVRYHYDELDTLFLAKPRGCIFSLAFGTSQC